VIDRVYDKKNFQALAIILIIFIKILAFQII